MGMINKLVPQLFTNYRARIERKKITTSTYPGEAQISKKPDCHRVSLPGPT
jgi:hypothetical protein